MRIAIALAVAAVSSVVVFVVVASFGRGDGGAAAFNACISQTRFVARVRHGAGSEIIETIERRAHRTVVGEFAVFASARAEAASAPPGMPLAGFGAANGRYALFTTVPAVDPDANAIENCWNRVFPLTS